MKTFESAKEAQAFVCDKVDVRIAEIKEHIGEKLQFQASTIELGGGHFTNSYDISYQRGDVAPSINIHSQLTSPYDHARREGLNVATGGGFFFLADRASA